MMLRQLKEFIEKNSFWGAYLLNTDLQTYLAPAAAPVFSEEQRAFLASAVATKRPVFLPVRRQDGELVMDMAFPVFAPLYVDPSGEKVVSVLVVTYNVLPLAKAVTRVGGNREGEFSSGILQTRWQDLQLIDPAARSGVLNLPGWRLAAAACRWPNARSLQPRGGAWRPTAWRCPCPVCPGWSPRGLMFPWPRPGKRIFVKT